MGECEVFDVNTFLEGFKISVDQEKMLNSEAAWRNTGPILKAKEQLDSFVSACARTQVSPPADTLEDIIAVQKQVQGPTLPAEQQQQQGQQSLQASVMLPEPLQTKINDNVDFLPADPKKPQTSPSQHTAVQTNPVHMNDATIHAHADPREVVSTPVPEQAATREQAPRPGDGDSYTPMQPTQPIPLDTDQLQQNDDSLAFGGVRDHGQSGKWAGPLQRLGEFLGFKRSTPGSGRGDNPQLHHQDSQASIIAKGSAGKMPAPAPRRPRSDEDPSSPAGSPVDVMMVLPTQAVAEVLEDNLRDEQRDVAEGESVEIVESEIPTRVEEARAEADAGGVPLQQPIALKNNNTHTHVVGFTVHDDPHQPMSIDARVDIGGGDGGDGGDEATASPIRTLRHNAIHQPASIETSIIREEVVDTVEGTIVNINANIKNRPLPTQATVVGTTTALMTTSSVAQNGVLHTKNFENDNNRHPAIVSIHGAISTVVGDGQGGPFTQEDFLFNGSATQEDMAVLYTQQIEQDLYRVDTSPQPTEPSRGPGIAIFKGRGNIAAGEDEEMPDAGINPTTTGDEFPTIEKCVRREEGAQPEGQENGGTGENDDDGTVHTSPEKKSMKTTRSGRRKLQIEPRGSDSLLHEAKKQKKNHNKPVSEPGQAQPRDDTQTPAERLDDDQEREPSLAGIFPYTRSAEQQPQHKPQMKPSSSPMGAVLRNMPTPLAPTPAHQLPARTLAAREHLLSLMKQRQAARNVVNTRSIAGNDGQHQMTMQTPVHSVGGGATGV